MNLAPIALFVYNRPEHTLAALESLSKCELADKSELFIFADGPKLTADLKAIKKVVSVRQTIISKEWCGKVNLIESNTNKGLANSIIRGVNQIINEFGKVIVLEDDLIVAPHFLEYMNDALEKYETNERVMQISAYMFPVKYSQPKMEALFLPFTTTWGWATWERAWKYFDVSMTGYKKLKNNKQLRYEFDMEGTYPYFRLLEKQIKGKVNSWGIIWYLSVFMNNGLTLHPTQTLVLQTGFDKDATHTKDDTLGIMKTELKMQQTTAFPEDEKIEQNLFEDYINYFRSLGLNNKFRIMKTLMNPFKLSKIILRKLMI